MKYLVQPNGYWTKERCAEEAKKHKTRTEFQRNSSGAYSAALENSWLDQICSHMEIKAKKQEVF